MHRIASDVIVRTERPTITLHKHSGVRAPIHGQAVPYGGRTEAVGAANRSGARMYAEVSDKTGWEGRGQQFRNSRWAITTLSRVP